MAAKDEMRRKIQKSQSDLRKKKKEEKEKKYMSGFSDKYHKEMEERQKKEDRKRKRELRRKKELSPAQKRFKEREAKGLSGLTGGPKGETLAQSRVRRKKAMTTAAGNRNTDYQAYKKGNMSLSDFIKKHPTSITAREAKKKGSSISRKLKKENLKLKASKTPLSNKKRFNTSQYGSLSL